MALELLAEGARAAGDLSGRFQDLCSGRPREVRRFMPMKGVLLGDQPLWRDALAGLLADQGWPIDLMLAASAGEVCRRLDGEGLDLILLDLSYPEVRGAPGLPHFVAASAPARVVALDERPNRGALERARTQGMDGYVTKTTPGNLLAAQLGVVLAGGSSFPNVAPAECGTRELPWSGRLSPRQRQVLELLLKGRSNQEIAEDLGIKTATVKLHVHAVLRASGARNRTGLVVLGLRSTA